MTRYAELKALVQKWREQALRAKGKVDVDVALNIVADELEAALALPEDSKTVNAELYGLAIMMLDKYVELGMRIDNAAAEHFGDASIFQSAGYTNGVRYLSLREASGEPMPYRVVRDGDKVRFE